MVETLSATCIFIKIRRFVEMLVNSVMFLIGGMPEVEDFLVASGERERHPNGKRDLFDLKMDVMT